jgi:hypothetical protein
VAVREESLARLEGPGTSLERLVFTDDSATACQALYCFAPTGSAATSPRGWAAGSWTTERSRSTNSARQPGPAVFAVGDMARQSAFPFAARQVITAAAQGITAAVVIDQKLLYND